MRRAPTRPRGENKAHTTNDRETSASDREARSRAASRVGNRSRGRAAMTACRIPNANKAASVSRRLGVVVIAAIALYLGMSGTGKGRNASTDRRHAPPILVTRDSTRSGNRCGPRAVATALVSFASAFNRTDIVALRRMVPETFQWFTVTEWFSTTDVKYFRAFARAPLLRYIRSRHAAQEHWRLRLIGVGPSPGHVGFYFVLQRTAADLPQGLGGNFRLAEGKGEMTCPGHRIYVWSMVMNNAPGEDVPPQVLLSCPHPQSWSVLNGPIIACTRT
jgi:hypothetical protein